jgi:dTDP-4-dehydrorhamnose 3,5-epimerase
MNQIEGVIITPLTRHSDSRGWLSEVWRMDELEPATVPQMGYLSLTHIGRIRGPHEHLDQTDLFIFLSGEFKVVLWDKTGGKMTVMAGERNPCSVLVPPGIVHAYQNIGPGSAFVLNFPNRLYAGWKRSEAVDEIRHEDGSDGRFEP